MSSREKIGDKQIGREESDRNERQEQKGEIERGERGENGQNSKKSDSPRSEFIFPPRPAFNIMIKVFLHKHARFIITENADKMHTKTKTNKYMRERRQNIKGQVNASSQNN